MAEANKSGRNPAEPGGEKLTVDPSTWPAGIRQLATEELSALGIDVNRRLYWHGEPVGLAPTLVLTFAQKAFALLLGSGALLAFLATFVQGWAAAFTWMCQVGWIATWCPVQ
jgi:hypothetical protein